MKFTNSRMDFIIEVDNKRCVLQICRITGIAYGYGYKLTKVLASEGLLIIKIDKNRHIIKLTPKGEQVQYLLFKLKEKIQW